MDRDKLLELKKKAESYEVVLCDYNSDDARPVLLEDGTSLSQLIDLALKGLDEWDYNTDAAPESFLGLIKGCETGRLKQAVIDRSDAEDADWLVAGDELSWAWDVIAWRALPIPPKEGGVK